MARRGFGGTALRAALGAVTGVAEGMRLREEREFEREKEKAAAARQAMLDAAALRREEREVASTMIPAERFASMTMPGATPMQAALRQTIGGQEFVYDPRLEAAEKHRADVMKERATLSKKAKEQTALGKALATVEIGGKALGEEVGASLAELDPNSRSIALGARRDAARPQRMAGKEEPSDEKKRSEGLQFLAAQAKNPALTKALQTTFANNPALAQDPGLAVYDIMKSKTVKPIMPFQEYKPPTKKEEKGDALESLKAEIAAEKAGRGTAAPAAAPKAPAAPARPSASSPPAQPSLVDKELNEQRKLWDDAVAKYGRERVEREVGPRP
jgi:hypothetical protein